MSTLQKAFLNTVRIQPGCKRAAVFVHGFSGERDDTWDRFPALLGMDDSLRAWDIYTVGYDTSLLPDVAGIWSADPDLPLLATQFLTELVIKPLGGYEKLALVAHSMGGLVVQRSVLDAPPDLRQRIQKIALFGTPSLGLVKAGWVSFLKPQLKNMAHGSKFISQLRADWNALGETPPFEMMVVAGSRDQFVPPDSSLQCFPAAWRRVVPGDHVQIVKPAGPDAESVRLLVGFLAEQKAVAQSPIAALRLAAERPADEALEIQIDVEDTFHEAVLATGAKTQEAVVEAALALDRAGKRDESIALLLENKDVGTDVQGTAGGRFKRLWLTQGKANDAERALALYQGALVQAQQHGDQEQIYYTAINCAFMWAAFKKNWDEARKHATTALEAVTKLQKEDIWSVATTAEAHLYLGDTEAAIALYKTLPSRTKDAWKLTSAGQQAYNLAVVMNDKDLAEEIDAIFSPGGGKIFISYSHRDQDWLERFRKQLAPYLQDASARLAIWDDTKIDAGDIWLGQIQQELEHCRVAILLVSDEFLNSEFIMKKELPVLLARARAASIRLYWFLLSACGWDATPLSDIQSAYPTVQALDELESEAKQKRALYEIARKIAKDAHRTRGAAAE